jgi:hypothetical protein
MAVKKLFKEDRIAIAEFLRAVGAITTPDSFVVLTVLTSAARCTREKEAFPNALFCHHTATAGAVNGNVPVPKIYHYEEWPEAGPEKQKRERGNTQGAVAPIGIGPGTPDYTGQQCRSRENKQ